MSESSAATRAAAAALASPSLAGARQREPARRLTGAQVALESLLREGVDTIFGYPGGANLWLYRYLPEYPQLRHVLVRHEQGGAHAADGYARSKRGSVGVVFATSGPGALNLVTGLATAYMDSVPVVAITGQVPTTAIGTESFQAAGDPRRTRSADIASRARAARALAPRQHPGRLDAARHGRLSTSRPDGAADGGVHGRRVHEQGRVQRRRADHDRHALRRPCDHAARLLRAQRRAPGAHRHRSGGDRQERGAARQRGRRCEDGAARADHSGGAQARARMAHADRPVARGASGALPEPQRPAATARGSPS